MTENERHVRALEIIKDNPRLIGLLYDLDLLPEQVKVGSNEWTMMTVAVAAYQLGRLEAITKVEKKS